MTTIPNKSGVYRLLNTENGMYYIGSANNLRTRKNHHFHKLREKTHANANLQEDYNAFGEKVFKFEIIAFFPEVELLDKEQLFIDSMKPFYNSAPTAGSMKGFEHSEETKQKISESMKKLKPEIVFPKRLKLMDARSMKNLVQFKDMSDEEFEKYYKEYEETSGQNEDFEKQIQEKLLGFEEDYDLSDMKYNDLETLRALIQAIIFLDMFDEYSYSLLQEDRMTVNNLTLLDKLETWKNNLRKSISNLQEDLKITRKNRKNDQSQNVLEEVERIKSAANEFYERKMAYVFCENCDMKLASVWLLYTDANNTLKLHCQRCKHKTSINLKTLYTDNKVSNKKDIPTL